MSRIYEALKKAEKESAVEQPAEETTRIYEALKKAEKEAGVRKPPAENAENGVNIEAKSAFLQRIPQVTSEEPTDLVLAPASTRTPGPLLLLSSEHPNKASDELQVLSLRVQSLALEHNKRVLLVTSSLPDEGKSFVALNLSINLARLGNRVMVIDADLRTPSLHLPFGIRPPKGLMTYLLGTTDFRGSQFNTWIPGLILVPSGGYTNSAPELFAGGRLRQFIDEAKQANPEGLIVIDSPPTLAASETRILAAMAEALLMVVAANRTPRNPVSRALALLKETPLLGLVLNRFEPAYSRRVEYGYATQNKGQSES